MTTTTTVTYRCDQCSVEAVAPRQWRGGGFLRPTGWTSYNGSDFCSYECLGEYVAEIAQLNPKRTTV